jgi:hypothetical protein
VLEPISSKGNIENKMPAAGGKQNLDKTKKANQALPKTVVKKHSL